MSRKKPDYKRAQEEADHLISKNRISAPPVNLEEIVENEGLNIALAFFEERDISGIINLEKKLMLVSKFDSIPRQRFTIAHELGHWILHQSEINKDKDLVVLYRKNVVEEDDPLEKEANFFAASLLVPLFLLKEYNPSPKNNKVLAEVFQVSESVMAYRRELLNGKD